MKKAIVIIILLLVAAMIYISTRQEDKQKTVYRDTAQPKATDTEKPKSEKRVEDAPASSTPQPNSGNLSPETGWSAFPGPSEPTPPADVTAQFNLGNGTSYEAKTVSAKKGQRISLAFTASIRDQVKIDGYTVETYVEPLRDSIIGFTADKIGQFPITLVKLKKAVGTLNVE